jgi:hypothetical protein
MNLVNIPTGNRPSVAHFCGKSLEGDFQKWLKGEIESWEIPPDIPPHFELVCFASAGAVERSPLIAQCNRLGIPITVLGAHMSDEEWRVRLHFNKLYLLRDFIDSGKAKTHIIALDAGDTLICGSLVDLANAYHKHYDGKIVFGAESHFMYKMASWNLYSIDQSVSAYEECLEVKRMSEHRCRTFAQWKYLNGGMMVAQRDALSVALNEAIAIAEKVPSGVYACDQSIWMWLWHYKPELLVDLDFECRLFQNVNHALPWDFCIDDPREARKPDGTVDAVFAFHGENTRDLALSVRLARKNLKNLGRIFVVGGSPRGVEGIEHIPFADPNVGNREGNITRKCLLACHLSRISDPFLFMSDDQFILKGADAAKMPLRHKGSLEKHRVETKYGHKTRNTLLELHRLGLGDLNFNTHWPVPIHKQQYVDALGLVPWDTEEGGLLCRSIYGNYAFGSNSEFCVDAKELARTAIAALKADCLSTPNSGADGLYPFLEAIAAR